MALAISAGWLGQRRVEISRLENNIDALNGKIAAIRGAPTGSAREAAARANTLADGTSPLDWKKLAARVNEMNRTGVGFKRLEKQMESMSNAELVAGLAEVANMEPPASVILDEMLVKALIRKDPQFALDFFAGRVRQDDKAVIVSRLAGGLKEWAGRDPKAAAAWFDRQIAEGEFTGKRLDGFSYALNSYEGALIEALLFSDPATAAARLAAMPEDRRGGILSAYGNRPIPEEKQADFANLVRNLGVGKYQPTLLARQARQLASQQDYSQIAAYLTRIQATPAERSECVEEASAAKFFAISSKAEVTSDDVIELRRWVETQAPNSVDRATGKALSAAATRMGFEKAAALAVQYHEASGTDDVLVAFLEGISRRVVHPLNSEPYHKDEISVLVEKIANEESCAEILRKLR